MVAAWMSAETGVGPSMASGSQLNSGIWADLPAAANRRRSTAAVAPAGAESGPVGEDAGVVERAGREKMRNIATRKPASPTRL